jgi:uncharacterized protein YjbI with pentapeptide repeats
MDDNTRAALDAEAPVNPYSLLDALNVAAARSTALWLLFLVVMAYAGLTVASLTHRDMLLDAGLALPLLQVRIGLVHLFVAAPVVFALAHLMLVAHFAVLSRKTLEFDAALRLLESTDLRSHPLRLELDSFFFVQALAGPERSRVVSAFLNAIGWLTLLVLPVLLLVWMQVAILPLHHPGVTALQRTVVLTDVVLVLLAGVFVMRAETTLFGAVLRLAFNNPGSMAFGLVVAVGAAFLVLFAATIPGTRGGASLLGVFPRSLNVADVNVVSDRGGAAAAGRLSLRGRDLRFARLDRSDLRGADLTGANLDGASLAGADLREANLGCVDNALLQQPGGRERAGCTRAHGADFTGASMAGASVAGADLRRARFDDASLEGTDLSHALASGATFERARMQRARLSGASLEGASLAAANLQGADLAGASLQMADLAGAALQAARVAGANLAGAVLRAADLAGADMRGARLYWTDLHGATLPAVDLTGAAVWGTAPPERDMTGLTDFAGVAIKPPANDEVEQLKAVAATVETLPSGERTAGLPELAREADNGWAASADAQSWTDLLRPSEAGMADGLRQRLAEHLARLACRARFADAAVAAGVARRAASAAFKGDPGIVADRLKAADCPAAKALPPAALVDLGAAAEAARRP